MRLVALFLLLALAGAGRAPAGGDLASTFAACAGRLSAQLEHQWLMRDPASERTERDRAVLLDMLDLVAAPGDDVAVMATRISAKQAHALLLRRATFNADSSDAAWARRRAAAEVAACTGLFLG